MELPQRGSPRRHGSHGDRRRRRQKRRQTGGVRCSIAKSQAFAPGTVGSGVTIRSFAPFRMTGRRSGGAMLGMTEAEHVLASSPCHPIFAGVPIPGPVAASHFPIARSWRAPGLPDNDDGGDGDNSSDGNPSRLRGGNRKDAGGRPPPDGNASARNAAGWASAGRPALPSFPSRAPLPRWKPQSTGWSTSWSAKSYCSPGPGRGGTTQRPCQGRPSRRRVRTSPSNGEAGGPRPGWSPCELGAMPGSRSRYRTIASRRGLSLPGLTGARH